VKIFSFGRDRGLHIDRYGSDFVISRLARTADLHVGCVYVDPSGSVGHHPASTCQLFIVVQGEGWVQGEDQRRIAMKTGAAAFWEPGERHGAGTETGMMALVVEGDVLGGDPEDIGPMPKGWVQPETDARAR